MMLVSLPAQLGERPAGVLDVRAGLLIRGSMGQEPLEVLHRLRNLLTSQQDEGESIVRARRRWGLLKDVAVGLRSLFDHPDASVTDSDLLEDDGVSRGLLQSETKRREGLVELAGSEELCTLVVVVDRLGFLVAQNLVPERHSRVS